MGALHDGHTSLIRRARSENDVVAVSLFVNPTQFGVHEDLAKYPRPFDRDVELARDEGVEILFAPEAREMYSGPETQVHVNGLSDIWEGAIRPGHFDGVATVVCKLFNIVQPSKSYFGLKDLQQCMVIRRMVDDLKLRVVLEFCETIRESDGLALSSRNIYLSDDDRSRAPMLFQTLQKVESHIRKDGFLPPGHRDESKVRLETAGFAVDYLEWVDLPNMTIASARQPNQALIVAAKLGSTRLIDNIVLKKETFPTTC